MHAGVRVFVCVRACVRALSFSSCCGESAFAQREVAHNYKFHLQDHKDKDSSGRAKRHPFLVGSRAYTADDYLCVCDGTCEWGKLSRNYTLLSSWPIISLKCERDCSARALLSTMAEDFKQTEEQGLNRVHIIQRESWRRRTCAVHQSASLNTWLWLKQVHEINLQILKVSIPHCLNHWEKANLWFLGSRLIQIFRTVETHHRIMMVMRNRCHVRLPQQCYLCLSVSTSWPAGLVR